MQKHRKYLVVTIWISTIAFVGAGFVGWGAYSFNADRASSVAKVGSKSITIGEFNNAYSNLYSYYNQLLNGELTQEKAKQMKLQTVALQQLIREALLLNYAEELGLTALKEDIEDRLVNTKAFQKNGVFDKETYYQVLKGARVKPKEYEDSLKKEIVLDKLKNILNLSATKSEKEAMSAALYMQDRVSIKIVTASDSEIKIDDNELKKYWENRKSQYLTKKAYELETVLVKFEDMKPTEDRLKEFYKDNKYKYKDENGKIKSFENALEEVKKDVQKKMAKKEALKKYLDIKKGRLKPSVKITLFDEEITKDKDKLLKAKGGDTIKPIERDNGYMVAKLILVKFPEPMEFKEAYDLVKDDYKKELLFKLVRKKANEALKNFNGKDIGYISRDTRKIDGLNPFEVANLVNEVFKSAKKTNFVVVNEEKAIVFKILEQNLLLDKEKFAKLDKDITSSVLRLKNSEIERSLISKLQKRYKIEQYYKGE